MGAQPAEGRLSHLHRTDGSATFAHNDHCIVASVNGPIEAQRRDEDPFEAVIDVTVRPAAGVGGTRERQLESLLQASLQQLICTKRFPRSVFQITLQVTQTPTDDYVNSKLNQAQQNLVALPALLHAALLALVSGAVPLEGVATAVVVAILQATGEPKIVGEPSRREASEARSLHVFGFTAKGDLLLAESEGNFTVGEWDAAAALGLKRCCGQLQGTTEGNDEGEEDAQDMVRTLRSITEAKAASDGRWR
ncbi:exosome non-catalytic core subunit rrp46 [Verticillium nonalfalfae]|uniref:Exosome non-catalytic core subunit rrp46 n=1 Tax=Verticillium nonalfalfae TaxID=1051616 RepID=A0A3M9Y313_9PEZI|nr:exosome non-catalytic core subunit rrp46 [Verticillium nonalfalfae]RNJ54837.1 exosome non-catalytic core subunit rrp46 [Verticillium nonalfalfae]